MKKLCKVLLCLALIIGIDRFCHDQTATFSLYKILENRPEDPTWAPPPLSLEEIEKISHMLDQKYIFLGHGNEAYAFLSQDGKTVIKFFKLQFLRPAYLKEAIRSPLHFKQTMIDARKTRLARTFDSLKIAYEEFRDETALIYVHLTPTTYFQKKLTIIDKLGIAHSIDLNTTKFVIQKKADLVYPKLDHLMKENKVDVAKQCISSLVHLIVKRCQLGIADRDATIRTNFGFVEEKAVEIDFGSFTKSDQPLICRQVLLAEVAEFKLWLKERYPPLFLFLNETLHEIVQGN